MNSVLFGSFIGGVFTYVAEAVLVILLIVGVIFVVMRFLNKDAASSWWHLGRTKVGQAGDYAKTIDTAGQMEQSAKDALKEAGAADEALANVKTHTRTLARKVNEDKIAAGRLEGKIAKMVKPSDQGGEGLSENDPAVVEKLKRLRDLKKAIATNETSIEGYKKQYETQMKKANTATKTAAGAIQRAKDLKVQLNLGAESEKLDQMLSKYGGNTESSMQKVNDFEAEIQRQLDAQASRAEVRNDRNAGLNDDDDDDDANNTPETDPELAGLLDGIKEKKGLKPSA
jgi:hypothetical protein